MSILEEIRKKPEKERKKILWITVFFVALILIILFFLHLKYNLSKIDFSNFKGPQLNTEDFKKAKEGIREFQKNLKDEIKKNEKDIKQK